jgi:hypothetical protein
MRRLLLALLLLATPLFAADDYLYNAHMVQAAPGRLVELIDVLKARHAALTKTGEPAPLWMRHSQGDRWDLLILTPVGSYAEFFRAERIAKRKEAAFEQKAKELIAWQENLYVTGPPPEVLKKAADGAAFFHVEIFHALAGKQAELYKQREMENAYSAAIGRPQNLIFVRDQGASWDLFTIGFYRDLKHYAESADIPADKQDAAARAAGFKNANDIGPYLRTLIADHHDTLAVAIK